MAAGLVTISPRKSSRWQFVEPIKRHDLGHDRSLLLHPATGSWLIIHTEQLPILEVLLQAANEGILDSMESAESSPLIDTLLNSGLLTKGGITAWSGFSFDHARNRVGLLILKLVGYCNLACTYCYDYNRATYQERMSLETARQAIDEALLRAGECLNILFHGGEPLLAFEQIRQLVHFARQKAADEQKRIEFSIQTNGTQFRPEVVEFLLQERFSVGVSLDGPQVINDLLRVDHAGNGHHARTEQALRAYPALTDRVGVLTTVTRHNVGQLRDIALYVQSLGVRRWDATLFQAAGRGLGHEVDFAPATEDLIASYVSLLDGIERDDFLHLEVRPVLHYIRNVLSYERRNMCLRNCCGAASDLVSVSVDGTIEACDCIKDPSLRIGSMRLGGIEGALDSEVAQRIRARSTRSLLPCQSCDWRVLCGGTCLAKAGGLDEVNEQECRLSMALFPEIFRRLAKSDKLERYARLFP